MPRIRSSHTAMSKKRNPRMGSSLDDFLKEEGNFEELQVQAIKEVVAWQLEEAMRKSQVSKARLAKLLRTSRTQVNRLLDPASDVTLSSLQRAAALVGRQVRLELVSYTESSSPSRNRAKKLERRFAKAQAVSSSASTSRT